MESRTFFAMESKILGFGLRNTTLGIRSPLTIRIRNPVPGIRNPRVLNLESKTVIPLHGRLLHNQEKKLWKLMKWSPKGKCFASFMATSLNQIPCRLVWWIYVIYGAKRISAESMPASRSFPEMFLLPVAGTGGSVQWSNRVQGDRPQ